MLRGGRPGPDGLRRVNVERMLFRWYVWRGGCAVSLRLEGRLLPAEDRRDVYVTDGLLTFEHDCPAHGWRGLPRRDAPARSPRPDRPGWPPRLPAWLAQGRAGPATRSPAPGRGGRCEGPGRHRLAGAVEQGLETLPMDVPALRLLADADGQNLESHTRTGPTCDCFDTMARASLSPRRAPTRGRMAVASTGSRCRRCAT